MGARRSAVRAAAGGEGGLQVSEPKLKHVWYDAEARKWVSAPFAYLPKTRHKPHGRRRMTRDAVLATAGGVR